MTEWNDQMTKLEAINTCTTCGEDLHLHFPSANRDHYFDQVPHTEEQSEVMTRIFPPPRENNDD